MKMPETVPWPSSREMGDGVLFERPNRCCMIGWALVAAGIDPCASAAIKAVPRSDVFQKFAAALLRVIGSDPWLSSDYRAICRTVGDWNDSHNARERAAAFRKAMRSLGYTEPVR